VIPIGQKETFRLVLSYYERAQSELNRWVDIRVSGNLDRTNFDQVRAKYAAHERAAHDWVKRLRTDAERQLGPIEAELRQKLRAQRKLIEAATAGTVDARTANNQNRVLTAEIAECSARASDLRDIVSAETTASLGGLINLPLEEYSKRLDDGDVAAPPKRPMTPLEKNIAAGIVMLTLVLGTVVGIAFMRSTVSAEFSVSSRDLREGFVRLECRNTGNRPIAFYLPWPNGRAQAPAGAPAAGRSFGVLISVREPGATAFRALEGVEGAFKYRGRLLEEGTPIEILPQTTSAIFLDLKLLREQGLDAEALAVEFSRSGGGESTRNEIELIP